MAYDKLKLVRESEHQVAKAPAEYSYIVNAAENIATAGYFPADCGLKAGDKVVKKQLTFSAAGLLTAYAETPYYIVASATGVLTATAIGG